ncbi:MAG: trigger factor [Roseburia sp.]|nr:trigger factor [Roseburia sp.]MCM1243232.1 trigger factor [Roseburia sp.]
MKKKTGLLAALVLLAGTLSACGQDKSFLSGIEAADYVTLGEYKGVEVVASEESISDEDVDSYVEYIRSMSASKVEVTDRDTVENGDIVNIDYIGYRDGEAFEGGTDTGYDLTIGSGSFIPGFEDGLIGGKVGETVSIDLAFPDDYTPNPDLAGVEVTFEVTINSISIAQLPELTDEYVQGLALADCTTVEEFRAYIRRLFEEDAAATYNETVARSITQTLMANCIFEEPPEEMVDRYVGVLTESMTARAVSAGMDLNTYMLNYYNMDSTAYMEVFREDAVTMAEQYIMFQAIADIEGLSPDKEEVAAAMEESMADFGYTSMEEFKENVSEDEFYEYIMPDAVMNFLIENAVIRAE